MTSVHREASSVALTARLLVDLLRAPRYARRWRSFGDRTTADINQAAVAHVLALHLWESGALPDGDQTLPRRLKDTVSRALSGAALSSRTLTLFIDAFEMSEPDASALWTARAGDSDGGGAVPIVVGAAERPAGVEPSAHRTLSLHELHTVGPGGMPIEHRTVQVIQATEPIDRYTFRCDTSAASVEVLRGGEAQPPRDLGGGLVGIDIVFPRPILSGQIAAFEFRTLLRYEVRPQTEFRRAAYGRIETVELQVQFDPTYLPISAWSADWDSHDDPVPRRTVSTELDAEHSLHRFVSVLENATIGFVWTFGD